MKGSVAWIDFHVKMTYNLSHMHGKILTEGNIRKQLWFLAWPIMASVFFHTLYNTVDAFWVSKLSSEAIAAVSISQISLFILAAFSMGITVGSGVLMAMRIGAKELNEARNILGQSFVLSAIAGMTATLLALVFKYQLLTASGATGAIMQPALEYFNVIASGAILSFIMFTIVFAFNAQGDNKTATWLFAISTALNAVLDPIFIFGWAIVPAMGIAGAAIATLISQAVFIILALYKLSRLDMLVPFSFAHLSFNWQSVKKVLNIGFPAALSNALGPIGVALTTLLAASYFKEAGAIAVSIGFRVEFFAFLPAIGFGFGSMAMLGQNVGAQKMERARQAYRIALFTGAGISAIFGLIIATFASPVVAFFTSDPVVAAYARTYLWMIPLTYGFLAAAFIEATSFQGAGKSWPGFWLTVIRIVVVALLALILLQVTHSILVLWISVMAGYIVASLVGYLWLNRTMSRLVVSMETTGPSK